MGGAGWREQEKKEALTRREKVEERGVDQKRKAEERGAEAERKRKLEQRKVQRWSWTERAEQIIFQQLFSFQSSQKKNYGEFVYVEFNF